MSTGAFNRRPRRPDPKEVKIKEVKTFLVYLCVIDFLHFGSDGISGKLVYSLIGIFIVVLIFYLLGQIKEA